MIGLYVQFFYFCIRNFRICFTFGTEHNLFTITSKGKISIVLTIPEVAIWRPAYTACRFIQLMLSLCSQHASAAIVMKQCIEIQQQVTILFISIFLNAFSAL